MNRNLSGRRGAASLIVFFVLFFLCLAAFMGFLSIVGRDEGPAEPTSPVANERDATLTVAFSPEKGKLLAQLVDGFNNLRERTPDREVMQVKLVELTPEEMVNQALAGTASFQALSPDSSLWLDQLNFRYAQGQSAEPGTIQPRLTGQPVRYAITPIVIAAWDDVARGLGWPEKAVSWTTLQQKAQSDANFRWSHPSTSYASGLLATLAEFYAGAGVQRGLTAELAQADKTIDFVAAVEKTVRFYGEGELAAIQRVAQEGSRSLDAFVISEQLLVAHNIGVFGTPKAQLVALYPAEGTLWADNPLALLETAALTPNQRRTFEALRAYLASPEAQALVLKAGFRPADLSVKLDSPGSPLTAANGVDPAEPQTTLQLPTPDVVSVVQNAWSLTKRKTNVVLVVDTSGSMQGQKLASAQTALRTFLSQIPSDLERVGMVEFNSGIANIIELDTLGANRTTLVDAVDSLRANGNTAFLDAVQTAYERLQREADPDRINAIVAMTDGRENASEVTLRQLAAQIREGNQDFPVVIFCVAYGRDADYDVMQTLADASGGQVREGTPETIRELYKILSSYF